MFWITCRIVGELFNHNSTQPVECCTVVGVVLANNINLWLRVVPTHYTHKHTETTTEQHVLLLFWFSMVTFYLVFIMFYEHCLVNTIQIQIIYSYTSSYFERQKRKRKKKNQESQWRLTDLMTMFTYTIFPDTVNINVHEWITDY